jgi:hypothetical protein
MKIIQNDPLNDIIHNKIIKMKAFILKNTVLLAFCLIFTTGCSVKMYQNRGLIVPQSNSTKLDFSTNKTVIILPVMLNGSIKNFAFDTGAELTVVQKEETTGIKVKATGADGKKVKIGTGTIDLFKISDVEFKNIYSFNANMEYLTKEIPDFGGLIGQSIICKANWLIDYSKNKIEFTDKTIETIGFETLSTKNIRNPHIDIIIEGEVYNVLIDLGSSVAMTIPENSKLAEKLLAKYSFKDNIREIFRLSGAKIVAEKVATLPKVEIGNSSFEKVEVNILPSKTLKIGNAFFKDYTIYIDNTNGVYKIKKMS